MRLDPGRADLTEEPSHGTGGFGDEGCRKEEEQQLLEEEATPPPLPLVSIRLLMFTALEGEDKSKRARIIDDSVICETDGSCEEQG